MSPEYFWTIVGHHMRKYFLVENQHFRANFFSSCQMDLPFVLCTHPSKFNNNHAVECGITKRLIKNYWRRPSFPFLFCVAFPVLSCPFLSCAVLFLVLSCPFLFCPLLCFLSPVLSCSLFCVVLWCTFWVIFSF